MPGPFGSVPGIAESFVPALDDVLGDEPDDDDIDPPPVAEQAVSTSAAAATVTDVRIRRRFMWMLPFWPPD
jgi:hypothetical protein